MKEKLGLLLAFSFLLPSPAQEARFFRVAGPVASTITAFSGDGYVSWTNEVTNATFTVQTAVTLTGPSNWVDYIQVPVTNPATTHRLYDPNPPAGMAFIPAGSFTMGNCMDTNEGFIDELPLHTVYVSSFYMDRFEVTKTLWDDVYQWATNNGYSFDYANSGQGKANNHPAHSMTWYDAVKWCNARSEKENKAPAYYTDATQTVTYRTGQTNVENDWVKWNVGYRLPTEAEWEKAARGGASGRRFPWEETNITHCVANYYSSTGYAYDTSAIRGYHPMFNDGSGLYTSQAGYFAPNGYGLYDMAGNVWEWCWDWNDSYSSGSQTDPRGPTSGVYRVFRGGGWGASADGCRTAFRYIIFYPDTGSFYVGLRSVLPSGQ